MKYSLIVENIKCGGCANTVTKTVQKTPSVSNIEVDITTGEVSFEAETDVTNKVQEDLLKAGYPTAGKGNFITTAKSYVSCAVGKMSKTDDHDK